MKLVRLAETISLHGPFKMAGGFRLFTDNREKGISLLTMPHSRVIPEMADCSDRSVDSNKVTCLVPKALSTESALCVKAKLVVSHKYWKCLIAIAMMPNRERALNMTVMN